MSFLERERQSPVLSGDVRGRGYIDMLHVLRILKQNGFDGALIPDHAPAMTCAAPWHAGMAYACGWMKAALQAVGGGFIRSLGLLQTPAKLTSQI